MIGERTGKAIESAVNAERKHCIEVHGEFNSHHEAWAVLQEECEEVMEAAAIFDNVSSAMMFNLWEMVKGDCVPETASQYLPLLREKALELVQEGVQVLAVCKKWQLLIEKERENDA
ncbi:MAG: hypothetical protein J6K99_07155 [Peptococcaceae bacterium]|nr:hypothetical protein [Peptococcaceae bacterium]